MIRLEKLAVFAQLMWMIWRRAKGDVAIGSMFLGLHVPRWLRSEYLDRWFAEAMERETAFCVFIAFTEDN